MITSAVNNVTLASPGTWPQRRDITLEEFFEIKDEDLRKYLFLQGLVQSGRGTDIKKENNDKLAYYRISKTLKLSPQGKFYTKNNLEEWISYDKKTKKVKISPRHHCVLESFIKEYLNIPFSMFTRCVFRTTPSLCKKIIEGKIRTIEDIAKYHKSYTVRNKDISTEVVYKFMVAGQLRMINSIVDPENITSDSIISLSMDSYASSIVSCRLFKFKVEEIGKLRNKYVEWVNEQSKEFDKIRGFGDVKNGNNAF